MYVKSNKENCKNSRIFGKLDWFIHFKGSKQKSSIIHYRKFKDFNNDASIKDLINII